MRKLVLGAVSALVIYGLMPATVYIASTQEVEARGGRGGGGGRHHVNRKASSHKSARSGSRNISNNKVNINIDNSKTVKRNYGHNDRYYDNRYYRHPVGTALAVTAAAIAIGSIVGTLPVGCTTVIVVGATYRQCGSVWYAPRYSGSNVNYIVVNDPY